MARRDTDVDGIKSGDLTEALIVGNAVDDQSVYIRELEARVCDRVLQCQHPEVVRIVFWEVAVTRVPYSNDRNGCTINHGSSVSWQFRMLIVAARKLTITPAWARRRSTHDGT